MPEYPRVEFALSVGSWSTADEALPDTGYDGWMLVPASAGREIPALPDIRRIVLPDGQLHRIAAWSGVLHLGDRQFTVVIGCFGTEFLIGRKVLDQLEVCFEFGERVRIRFDREKGA